MASSSLEYWKRREKEARANTIKDEKEYNARLNEIYNYTAANIERTVNDWYTRYAKKHNITMAEARARVSKLDMERYEKLAARYVRDREFSAQANEEMEIYNLTMRINRLELLRAQINLELMAGYDDIEKEMERDLIKTAMKEDRRLAGILGNSVIGNEQYAKELVNASFHNATFSERLWGSNMPALRTHLEAELRNGLVQGIHPRELARRFRQHYGGSVKDTERLMVTEMRRLQTSVQKESFERNGFREYTFITTGDERVCEDCDALNGQHFKVSEMQPGENAPPMHPSCRCSTAAYMDSDKYKRWIEALANGEDVRWDEFEADKDMRQTGGRETGGYHYVVKPEDTERERQAAKAYERFAREDDSKIIADNTGFSVEDIIKIRRHIFFNKHRLYVGYTHFDPDYNMAVAWERLKRGEYLDRDITLLRHELLESELEKKYNIDISEAHARATKTYDWWGQVEKELGEEGEPDGLLQTYKRK